MIHCGLQTSLVAMAAGCNAGLHALVVGSKHKHGSLLFEKSSIVSEFCHGKIQLSRNVRLCRGAFCTLTDIILPLEKGKQDMCIFFYRICLWPLVPREELLRQG